MAIVLSVYVVVSYVLAPQMWILYSHRHPALDQTPDITFTSGDHPGGPINVAVIGTEADLTAAVNAAEGFRVDALGLRSDLRIAADTVLNRPFDDAPVSSLYLWGRRED